MFYLFILILDGIWILTIGDDYLCVPPGGVYNVGRSAQTQLKHMFLNHSLVAKAIFIFGCDSVSHVKRLIIETIPVGFFS